jgi:hypothetical protein
MGGMKKMQDFEGICPITKVPIFLEHPSMTMQQSPKHCFPMNLYACKETKKAVHNHGRMFEHCKACGHPDTIHHIALNTDMLEHGNFLTRVEHSKMHVTHVSIVQLFWRKATNQTIQNATNVQ